MQILGPELCHKAFDVYQDHPHFFPLIGAVLEGKQNGLVFADGMGIESGFFVEHSFGFAQVIGPISSKFANDLKRYLLGNGIRQNKKMRLYTPFQLDFLEVPRKGVEISYRQRFKHCREKTNLNAGSRFDCGDTNVSVLTTSQLPIVEQSFCIAKRFWKNESDFCNFAMPVIVWQRDEPASICYAAAISSNIAEIDVVTKPEFQKKGLAFLAVKKFIELCCESKITASWDCFTNNEGSMKLAKKAGFIEWNQPYPFYTIKNPI